MVSSFPQNHFSKDNATQLLTCNKCDNLCHRLFSNDKYHDKVLKAAVNAPELLALIFVSLVHVRLAQLIYAIKNIFRCEIGLLRNRSYTL